MEKKIKYSVLVGLVKTAKNSAFLLIPFILTLLTGLPLEYAWLSTPLTYFLKNLYENKIKQ